MKIIEEFIRNKMGKATYRSWLTSFFEAIHYLELLEQKGTHKKYKIKKDIDNYFKDNRNYDSDAVAFGEFIKDWAPGARKGAISCMKNFFMFNNIRLQPKTEYQLREIQKGPKAITIEVIPDRKMLKEGSLPIFFGVQLIIWGFLLMQLLRNIFITMENGY